MAKRRFSVNKSPWPSIEWESMMQFIPTNTGRYPVVHTHEGRDLITSELNLN